METPIEYVTREELNAAVGELRRDIKQFRDSIAGRLDQTVEHIEVESQQRQKEIERIDKDLEMIATQAQEAFERNDQRFDGISHKLDELSASVNRIAGTMESWSEAMSANRQLFSQTADSILEHKRELDDIRHRLDKVDDSVAISEHRIAELSKTIFGGDNDGPDSIFYIIKHMGHIINSGFERVQSDIAELSTHIDQNRTLVTSLRRDYETRLQRTESFWTTVYGLLGDPRVIAVLFSLILGVIASMSPELAHLLNFTN